MPNVGCRLSALVGNVNVHKINFYVLSVGSNYLILKKTDMESVFNLFQDCEKNKMLVHMLLSFLMRKLFPSEHSLNVSAAALQKVTNLTN